MHVRRVFPRLREAAVVEKDVTLLELAKYTLLFVLFDGVSCFARRNLVLFSVETKKSCVELSDLMR